MAHLIMLQNILFNCTQYMDIKNGYYLPLVYFFLPNKTRSTYIKMWQFLNNLCLKLCEKSLQINTFHVDFEIGAHQAITDVFGNIKIIGCRFHLGQSWWKKIVGEPSLRIAYMDNSNELGKWLKMFFGLAFISPEEVVDAFHELISICPNDDGFIFSDYIIHNYIEDHCQFPPNIWAETPSLNPRTTNAAESFHRTYNSQFYSPHPHVHTVVRVLIETQAETSTKINSIRHKPGKLQSAKEIKKNELNIQAYSQFLNRKNTESLLIYLSQIGSRYQGVSI
ncbi:uncharacterized protein LOC112692032 [Sipha flava]|uniref:Uncharacterized protein LOC112692032 n=1 Tax=Sipha flava TaxID=143950 RepID=A0A8B8GIH8_9HEMI|nr:uncharacterized protein LOC112692032 [Sipha flava]